MKKTYIIPSTSIMQAQAEQILAASIISGNDGNGDMGIGYGGVDTDGGKDPSVKESNTNYEWDF